VKILPFVGDEHVATARTNGATWLDHVQRWRPHDPDQLVTGDHEVAVLLLAGTFDLVGGSTVWPARGARSTPFQGRPMAVFLPKHTPFRVGNGRGEILCIAARQPVVTEEATGRDALAQKPLLPLAGSGKAFDPKSGEWKPAETFPTAPESLPPRRFVRIPVGSAVLERVFAPDYKAATLSVDAVVLAANSSLRLGDVPAQPRCDELLLFVRSDGGCTVGGQALAAGDHALLLAAGEIAATSITTGANAAYIVFAYAGKA